MKPILPLDGSWVGPSLLVLKLRLSTEEVILDGRKRLSEHERRGLKNHIPKQVVTNHLDAIKQLIHNNHQDRAAAHALEYCPEAIHKSAAYLQGLFNTTRHKLIPYMNNLRSPSERHKLPRRAIGVVGRLQELKVRVEEEGYQPTLQDLEGCLREFLKD